MNEITIGKAPVLTSPNPLVMVCTEKPDGSTNIAPVSFVTYLSFNPPVIGFAMGQTSYTGERIRETGKAIITVPGSSLKEAVTGCGSTSGRNTDKAARFGIELTGLADSSIKFPPTPGWPLLSHSGSRWRWAITISISVTWTKSMGMRQKRRCSPGTDIPKRLLHRKSKQAINQQSETRQIVYSPNPVTVL